MTRFHHLRGSRALSFGGVSVLGAVAALLLTVPGSAGADSTRSGPAVPPPPAAPTSADQIQNIDQVRTAIKGYYGDMIDPNRVNPIDNTPLHTFNPNGNYAQEMATLTAGAAKYLDRPKPPSVSAATKATKGTKAVLFDVDDTLLNTYSYEIYSNFVYNPTTNAAFVNAAAFPAVPHMVNLEQQAIADGYTVFFLTGRPAAQRNGTLANLTGEGYTVNANNVYLKDLTAPWLSPCAPTCTTIQYKSLTRKYIESQGYDIVANFGDQYSDLSGGYADKTFKLPNPMYYLP